MEPGHDPVPVPGMVLRQAAAVHLKALRGPFPEARFVPTGGVSEQNVGEWFDAGAYAVGVGGALAPKRLESDNQRDKLVSGARRLIEKVAEARAGGSRG